MNLRIGQGYDVHKLVNGESLILGGVKIPHKKGTLAHSDGDVLIHAIIDSLLGAVNIGDIGTLFPDNNIEYKNIDSTILLSKTVKLIYSKKYEIVNIDSTIILQKPRIANYIPEMKVTLSKILGVDITAISIKATTTEKLGFEGKEEGVSAQSVCLVCKLN